MKNPLNDIVGQIASLDHIGQAISSANIGQAVSLSNIGQAASLDYIGRAASAAEAAHLNAAYAREGLLSALAGNSVNEFMERERRLNLYGIDHSVKAAAQRMDVASSQRDVMQSVAEAAQASLTQVDHNALFDNLGGLSGAGNLERYIGQLVDGTFPQQDYVQQLREAANDIGYSALADGQTLSREFASQFAASGYADTLAEICKSAAGPLADANSFAQLAAKQMESYDLGAYSSQLRSVVEHIDFDAIKSFADERGECLTRALDTNDEPFSADSLHEAIEQTGLGPLKQAVEDAVFAALEKAGLSQAQWKRFTLWILACVLLPFLFNTYQAYLAHQLDAKAAPEKKPQVVSPESHFDAIVAVKPELLTLRAGPSTRESVLATAHQGQFLRVLKKKGLWMLVLFVDPLKDGVSYTGWVKVKQTQRLEDETARLLWCGLLSSHLESTEGCHGV